MPAVAFNLYDLYRRDCFNGGALDIDAASLKMMVVTSAYSVNQNAHNFVDDVIANEVTGTGYTARGNACAVGTVTMDAAGLITVDCDDPAVWTQNAAGFSNARRAILYDDTGTNGTSRLVGYSADFGADKGNVDGDFTVTINAAGIYTAAR